MITTRAFLAATLTGAAVALGAAAQDGDVDGTADLPGVGRFEGAVITGYDAREFDEHDFTAGPVSDPASTTTLEGRVVRVAYRAPEGASIAQVFRSYESALESAGYEVVFSCDQDDCGANDLVYQTLPIPQMQADPFNYRYLAARRGDPATDYASLLVSGGERVYAEIDAVTLEAFEARIVTAEEMASGLEAEGHIALYGVYFDTDSATIKDESRPTLEQMAALLGGAPELEVVIVGHTDSQGGYDYNMDLSQRRAEAVAARLADDFEVDRGRLRAAGVGYLAPVASNASEDGRALNRRVELVAP